MSSSIFVYITVVFYASLKFLKIRLLVKNVKYFELTENSSRFIKTKLTLERTMCTFYEVHPNSNLKMQIKRERYGNIEQLFYGV
jgi:hypothetical protein